MPNYYRDEDVFLFIPDFHPKLLQDIMKIYGWNNQRLASLLGISQASVNNYLGNASMTNDKPSTLSEPQFITLLMYMQRKIEERDSLALAFAAFTMLCPGLLPSVDTEKLFHLVQIEDDKAPKRIICDTYASAEWFPCAIRNLNVFVDWQRKGKDKSLCEYLSIGSITELLNNNTPASEDEKELAMENAKKVIPLYLKMFMSARPV